MNEQQKLEGLVTSAMEKIKEMVECETIIGKPITVGDGTTIIPVSKVSLGFATGGSDLPSKNTKDLFGGGSGAGVSISPIAFIAISSGEVKLLQLSMNADKGNAIVNMVPEVLDKITDFLNKKKGENSVEE